MSSATVVVEKDDGYQATYFYDFFQTRPTPETIDDYCNRFPNVAYRFEEILNHFLIYKDNFFYDDGGNQYTRPELVGIEEGDFGEASIRERCLELLLSNRDILYKTVFLKKKNSSKMNEVTTPQQGWVE